MSGVIVVEQEHFDFLQRNGTWLLSMLAVVMSCITLTLGYFLRSRCTSIKCCGVECSRDVLNLTEENDLELRATNNISDVMSSVIR